MNSFVGFPKIPRLSRACIISEKIDGTNGQVFIWDQDHRPRLNNGEYGEPVGLPPTDVPWLWNNDQYYVAAGSKNQWVTLTKDNHKFAHWVTEHATELLGLGHGRHFGEWWGYGIQRGYGLKEKRFSLFNVKRWGDDPARPACCHVVPILAEGLFDSYLIKDTLDRLIEHGSYAAPGFMNPEGIIIYHVDGNCLFKKTIKDDDIPKSAVE